MRRLLRDVAEHRELGDVTTLMDPTVVNMIDEKMRRARAPPKTAEPNPPWQQAAVGPRPGAGALSIQGRENRIGAPRLGVDLGWRRNYGAVRIRRHRVVVGAESPFCSVGSLLPRHCYSCGRPPTPLSG